MFSTTNSTVFETDKPVEEVYKVIEEHLRVFGSVKILPNGIIRVNTNDINTFAYEVIADGRVKEKDGRYHINFETEMKLTGLMWVLILCLVGLIMFLLPYIAKGKFERDANIALSDIRLTLKKSS